MGLPDFLAPAGLFGVVALSGYILWEVWAWFSGNRAGLTVEQIRRRVLGGLLLIAALLMLTMANIWMAGRPPREKLVYLGWMFVLTLMPMMIAVRESAFIARQYAQKRADIVRSLIKHNDTPGPGG